MNDIHPSVYMIRKSHDKAKIYFGGYSSHQGLMLFDKELGVSVTSAFFETCFDESGDRQKSLLSTGTVAEATALLCPEGPFDFSCEIEGGIQFSSHDDGECHIVVPSVEAAKRLFELAAPESLSETIWDHSFNNLGCYVAKFDGLKKTSVFQDFDSYLIASNTE